VCDFLACRFTPRDAEAYPALQEDRLDGPLRYEECCLNSQQSGNAAIRASLLDAGVNEVTKNLLRENARCRLDDALQAVPRVLSEQAKLVHMLRLEKLAREADPPTGADRLFIRDLPPWSPAVPTMLVASMDDVD